jgi:hypothetical protein
MLIAQVDDDRQLTTRRTASPHLVGLATPTPAVLDLHKWSLQARAAAGCMTGQRARDLCVSPHRGVSER